MQEKRMGFWDSFTASLSDFTAFKKFIGYGTPQVLWYFLTLIFISSLVLGACGAVNFQRQVHKVNEYIKKHIGNHYIEYNQGVISTDLPQPFKLYQDNDYEVVIDTKGKTAELENGVLIMKDRILVIDKKKAKREERLLSDMKGSLPAVTINKEMLDKFAEKIIGPTMWVVIWLWNFCFGIVLTLPFILIYTLVGLIFNNNLPQPLSYAQIWVVGIFAMTAPKVFEMIFEVLKTLGDFSFPYGFFFIIFSTIYLVYLLRGMASTNEQPPVDEN